MKKLLLIPILLMGCATKPAEKTVAMPTKTFQCAALGRCGVYARWTGYYMTLEDANAEAKVIVQRLYDQKLVPENYAECFEVPAEETTK